MGEEEVLNRLRIPDEFREALRDYLSRLRGALAVDEVLFFGSRVYGEPLKSSDLDMIVVSPDFEGMSFPERLSLLSRLWLEPYPLEVLGYTTEELSRYYRKKTVVTEALDKGVRIRLGGAASR